MAAQRYKDILFSYSGLISSSEEIQVISNYFASIQSTIAQADYSEILDLRKYTVRRSPVKIKKLLREKKDYPFLFISCLN